MVPKSHREISDSQIIMNKLSGQIIVTSHDLTPKCSWGREITLFQENPGW